jgi:putative Ca2+/H+ antiporter (TMEM165/GDT1 family)
MKELLPIFLTVFLAELGDKTQLATILLSADGKHNPWVIFFVAGSALIASTAMAVVLGQTAEKYLTMIPLKLIAGSGFMILGAWMVWEHFSAAGA